MPNKRLLLIGLLAGCALACDSYEADIEEARTAIITEVDTACVAADECAFLLYGSKPCGGPTDYVVYSKTTTDEATLKSKADVYTKLQADRNADKGLISDCSVLIGPNELFCRAGACTDS